MSTWGLSSAFVRVAGSGAWALRGPAGHLPRVVMRSSSQPPSADGMRKNHTVVFIRHGQSDFNKYEIFTGWCDVDVNKIGEEECRKAGMLLASHGYEFDVAYTSVLKRATKSCWSLLDGCDQHFIPIKMHWKLNERHYGNLQGLSKEESERRLGPIVKEWRRSWDVPPPDMEATHPHWNIIANDRRYKGVPNIPRGESLEMCSVRVKEYWDQEIVPEVRAGKRIVIVAHANSLRSLFKKLDGMTEDNIRALKVDNGQPIIYNFDSEMNVVGKPDEIGFRGTFLREKSLDTQVRLLQKELLRQPDGAFEEEAEGGDSPLPGEMDREIFFSDGSVGAETGADQRAAPEADKASSPSDTTQLQQWMSRSSPEERARGRPT